MRIEKTWSLVLAVTTVASMTGSAYAQYTPEQKADLKKKADFMIANPPYKTMKGIPTNFPIPVYSSNVSKQAFCPSSKGHRLAAAATIWTTDAPDEVFQWYQNSCKKDGWAVAVPNSKANQSIQKKNQVLMLAALKPGQQATILCIRDPKTPGTMITVSWSKGR